MKPMISLDAVLKELNTTLKQQSGYEPWMRIAAIKEEEETYYPLVTAPPEEKTALACPGWADVYRTTITSVALRLRLTFDLTMAPDPSHAGRNPEPGIRAFPQRRLIGLLSVFRRAGRN